MEEKGNLWQAVKEFSDTAKISSWVIHFDLRVRFSVGRIFAALKLNYETSSKHLKIIITIHSNYTLAFRIQIGIRKSNTFGRIETSVDFWEQTLTYQMEHCHGLIIGMFSIET